jgi:transcriptional regulator with XRE-family HTH domain
LRVRNEPDRRQIWATYIRTVREATGMGRPELARRLGVDPATVWRWEQGKQKPEQPDIPMAVANLFGLDADEVLVAAGLKVGTEPPARPEPEFDAELEAVRTDPDLDPDTKVRIVDLILERREREREQGLAETRRLIDLMKRRA